MSKISKEQSPNIIDMSTYRIITKNLVYVIGLSETIAIKETLVRQEYFGQYGTIIKLIINTKKAYNQNSPHGPSYSAYVTYSKPTEASIAILSLDNTVVDNHLIRASFGTTKYCTYFLRNMACTNKHCLFLHSKASENDIIKRDELNSNQAIFYDQQLYAIKIADIYNPNVKKALLSIKKTKTRFPSPDLIYQSEIVIENDPQNKKIKANNTNTTPTPTNSKKKEVTEQNNRKAIESTTIKNKNNKLINQPLNNEINKHEDNNNHNHISLLDVELSRSKETKEEMCASFSTASDDKSKSSTFNNSITNHFFQIPKIFESKDKSRFNFIQLTSSSECNCDENEVPSFVQNIINKSTKLLPFKNHIKGNYDDTFAYIDPHLNNKTKPDDITTQQWTQFIINNKKSIQSKKSNKIDDEFIDDFDKINTFILKKINM